MNLNEQISRIKEMMGLLTEEQKIYSTILIFGPQGVGKSTLTKQIGEKLGMQVIGSDDHIDQGDWVSEKTRIQGWLKRKENEFIGMIDYLKKNLGKPVILDIGGSHGVWEGEQLKQILSMISNYPNRFLILPTEDISKSKEFLRNRLLKRESDTITGAIKYWEALLKRDESFANNYTPEDREEYLKQLDIIKNGDESHAKWQIDRMQKRLDIIKSGNVNWDEFDINDKDAPKFEFKSDKFYDTSQYLINNMKNSGIANYVVHNMGKDNEKLVDEIISKLE